LNTESKITDVAAALDEAGRKLNEGQFEDAGNMCQRILAEDPENVRALNVLGASMARTGKIGQAIAVAEKVCALSPANAVFHGNLSYLYRLNGQFLKARAALANAVLNDTENAAYQAGFSQVMEHLEFHKATAETETIKEAIRTCMANPAIDAATFSTAWHSLLLLDPVFDGLATLTGDGDFTQQAEQVNTGDLAESLADPFLLLGMRSLHARGLKFERIMTFLRRLLLSRLDECDPESFLPFLCALAEHCNLNEYVYSCTAEELAMVAVLAEGLDLAADIGPGLMARVALVACYKDPMGLACSGAIAQASVDSQNDAFTHFIRHTISIPTKTRGYLESILADSSASGSVQNAVSSSVAKQYEESPYPRWRHLEIPALSDQLRAKGRGREILVAGCGTGQEPLNLAVHYPEARVLGLDLSASSLAYGKQKAVEFGVDNVEFMQADILDIEGLGRQFDLISCSGVLHHMEDPLEGWRRLLACLKPDGYMKIALYSEAARQTVVACRNWIEEQGFAATPQGIRDFRQAIMALDADNPLTDIVNWTDFYSMSMCRDLVFHVQERRVTLPWIKSVLDDLQLSCLSMRISNPQYLKEYLSKYAGDQDLCNLDTLHEYENHNPKTFRDMYSFWCCRKESAAVARRPAWFYTEGLAQ
jgi:ubiquinone/menaquinone biosynthesis C-methylase UbiE/tetratricopeptide (TPR) repeat protein